MRTLGESGSGIEINRPRTARNRVAAPSCRGLERSRKDPSPRKISNIMLATFMDSFSRCSGVSPPIVAVFA